MEIEFLGRKKKPVCDKVIVFSENGRKREFIFHGLLFLKVPLQI